LTHRPPLARFEHDERDAGERGQVAQSGRPEELVEDRLLPWD
jgi:hypothetical protein